MKRETVKILHCADLHLGFDPAIPGETGRIRKTEINRIFKEITDICKKQEVDILLIAGDLFEGVNIERSVVDDTIQHISDIPDTTVVISPGNHDPFTADSYYNLLEWPENTIIFSSTEMVKRYLEEKDVYIWGRAFTGTHDRTLLDTDTDNIELDDSKMNICVIHGDIASRVPDSPYGPVPPWIFSDPGFDYIALGHVHKRTKIQREGKSWFSYPGCPTGHGFDETGRTGVYLGTLGKNHCDIRFFETGTRHYLEERITIGEFKSNAGLAEYILSFLKEKHPSSYEKELFKIILEGKLDPKAKIDTEYLNTALSDELFFAKVIDGTSKLADFEKLAGEVSLKGLFVKEMMEKMDRARTKEEKYKMERALEYGLRAFEGEVRIDEDKIDIDRSLR